MTNESKKNQEKPLKTKTQHHDLPKVEETVKSVRRNGKTPNPKQGTNPYERL